MLLRPRHQEIVLGRLTEFGLPNSVIRRLFDVGAVIRVENGGRGGRSLQFCWVDIHGKNFPITKVHFFLSPNEVSYHHPINYIPQSLPVEGGSHREPLANDLLMYWTEPTW